MSSSEDSAAVQQSTTAEMSTVALQADDEGKLARLSGRSADDVDGVLGSWGSGDCGGEEPSNEGLDLHLEK